MLQCVRVSRSVPGENGPLPLLRDISFELERGEVLAIVGPSGAGKSTLLRLLNRLDEPTSGDLFLCGRNYRSLDPRQLRRRVGIVLQRAYLFPGTAAMNVGYGPAQHGQPLSTQQVGDLLSQVGMGDYGLRDVATLSGGEAQRVSIARTLANNPDVLLLDEPTSALDPQAKQGIESLLARLVRERGATCVWVTHDPAQACRVAGRFLRVQAGRIAGMGSTQELLNVAE